MARRWRPQRFADVIGQDHVTKTLQRAIARGRVAHAYIFAGPRGVGKTTTARLLAKAINCHQPVTDEHGLPEPCNECPACEDITGGGALDVIEIDGASNNKVEDVRTLRENIKFAPSSLRRKVYIIDEVHMLSPAAFNALLKTLEEPPEHAMFIFATTEIHKVPATVLSRCQRFDFKRIPAREIKRQLEKIVAGDKLKVEDDALVAISLKAEGALRDGLSILDQLVAYQGEEGITLEGVRQALGLIGTELYFRTTGLAAGGMVAPALALADDLAAGGHDPREYLRGLQRHLMNLLFLRAGGSPEELDAGEEDRARYAEAARGLSDEDLLRMGEWAAETEDILRDALDPGVRLELFLVRLAVMDRAVEIGALLERLGVAPESLRRAQGTDTPPAARPSAPPARATASPDMAAPAAASPAAKQASPPPGESPAATAASSGGGGSTPETAAGKQESPGAERDGSGGQPSGGTDKPATPGKPKPPGDSPEPPPDDDPGPPPPKPPDSPSPGASGPSPEENGEPEEENDILAADEGESTQLSLVDLRAGWLELCDRVNGLRRTLGVHLEQGAPTAVENGAVEITFDPANEFEYEQVARHRQYIQRALRLHFGASRKVILKRGSVPESARPPRRKSLGEKQRELLKKALERNPVWRDMMQRFDLELEERGGGRGR